MVVVVLIAVAVEVPVLPMVAESIRPRMVGPMEGVAGRLTRAVTMQGRLGAVIMVPTSSEGSDNPQVAPTSTCDPVSFGLTGGHPRNREMLAELIRRSGY
jgi:hypothetical protein